MARFPIYALLLAGSAVFLFPLVWMICTSLKPVEQTMTLPLTWLPRAYYATVDGQRMEVTRDYQIEQPSVIVVPREGPTAGKRVLLPAAAFDRRRSLARIQVFENGLPTEKSVAGELVKDVAPGWWHVTEFSATVVRGHELAWDVVPESALEARIRPRWENYPNALATMGGRSLEEVEGSVERRGTGVSEDTEVSFRIFLCNTLLVCVLGVIGSVFSNAVIAYGFTRVRWRGRDALFAADAGHDDGAVPGADGAAVRRVQDARLDRHAQAAVGAGVLRQRVQHLPHAPVLPHHPRGTERGGAD